MTTDYSVQANTAEEMRAEVVAYFTDQMDRIKHEHVVMKPKTKVDQASYNVRLKAAENARDFFRDMTITPKAKGAVHVRIREDAELAMTYAEDGAFHTAADRFEELAANVRAHADECAEALKGK